LKLLGKQAFEGQSQFLMQGSVPNQVKRSVATKSKKRRIKSKLPDSPLDRSRMPLLADDKTIIVIVFYYLSSLFSDRTTSYAASTTAAPGMTDLGGLLLPVETCNESITLIPPLSPPSFILTGSGYSRCNEGLLSSISPSRSL